MPATAYHHGNLSEAILIEAAEIIDKEGIEALSLRGIARAVGVSHSAPNRHFANKKALLEALASKGWHEARDATLAAAEQCGSDNPHRRLNAMGRGFLRWALNNRALFRAIYHPDVSRQASDSLHNAVETFAETVQSAIQATQRDGRHSQVPLPVLALFTNAVPTGAAMLLLDSVLGEAMSPDLEQEELIAQLIDLVVPLPNQ